MNQQRVEEQSVTWFHLDVQHILSVSFTQIVDTMVCLVHHTVGRISVQE